jgi:hypothetical protein
LKPIRTPVRDSLCPSSFDPSSFEKKASQGGALKAASGRGQLIFTSFGPDRMTKCLSSSSLPIKTWHYVALVRNGDVVNVYLNGNSEPVITCESTAQYDAQDAFTFGGGSALFPTLEGKLDEIAVYDRVLSGREIAGHYQAAASR